MMDIHQEQITSSMELPEDLPPVLADGIQIQQVLLNLIRNAVEAMHKVAPDGRKLTVTGSASSARLIEVAIADSGSGCPPEAFDKMYDAFFTTKRTGLGMGLSMSRGGLKWSTWGRVKLYHFAVCSCT